MRGCLTWFFVLLRGRPRGDLDLRAGRRRGARVGRPRHGRVRERRQEGHRDRRPAIELLTLRADKVRIQATNATFAGLRSGRWT